MSENKCYFIVGASGGIGSALARQLHAEGASLFLVGRRQAKLEALASELEAGCRCVDASRFDQLDRALASAVEEMGGLDGAVNCAGSLLLRPAQLTGQRDYERVIQDNLTTAFSLVRAVAKNVRQGPLSLVLISSAVSRLGLANHEAIAAAKAGVVGLARSAAATYARRGIRINAVAPGLVETPLTKDLLSRDSAREASLAMHPLGRIGNPEEVSRLITWLLSERSAWMTGEVLHLDGGLASLKT